MAKPITFSVVLLVALILAAPCWCQDVEANNTVTGWQYSCDAQPLSEEWADPGFKKLNDGDKNPSNSAIFRGAPATVDITLPGEVRLTGLTAYVHRHNSNYKLSKMTVQALQAGQWVSVGQNTDGFWGETKQAAFVLKVPLDVTARQLRVDFYAASIVSIQEIEIQGTAADKGPGGEYQLAPNNAAGARVSQVDADGDGKDEIVLENPLVRLIFEPDGGVCRSMLFKSTGDELVGGEGRYGLLRDQLWSPNYPFSDRYYFAETGQDDGGAWVKLATQGLGGMMSFTHVSKRITLGADSPAVKVHYELLNDPNSQTEYKYGFWMHNILGVAGQDCTYFFPTTDGVVEKKAKAGEGFEVWHWNPARGWAAYVCENGTGLAATMDYKHLNCFYMWAGAGTVMPTFEWRYNRLTLGPGDTFETDITLVPFTGLSRVDGVFGDVVAGLSTTANGPETIVDLAIVSPRPNMEYRAVFTTRELPAGERTVLNEPNISAQSGAVHTSFSHEFPVGGHVVEAALSTPDGKLGSVERPVFTGDVKVAYKVEPLEERVGETGMGEERKYAGHELSTEVETPHFKWAKPYYRGPVKALVLCDDRYSREVIELWQRLEMEFEYVKFYTTLDKEWLYHGDRSILTLDAAQRRLTEKLEQDYDVIVLSGLKWDHHFTPKLRQTIADKVKQGTGLVYIEPEGLTPDDDLEGVCGIPDGEKRSLGIWGSWEPSAEHYITSGLPWESLPRTRMMPFTTPPVGQALASWVGRTEQPLIVAGQLGEGRVLTLTYDTLTHTPSYRGYSALTPAISYRGNYLLPDEMEATTWQYWEYWWALLTRCTVWASGEDSGVQFLDLGIDEPTGKLTGKMAGDIPADASLDVIFRDRFSGRVAQAQVKPVSRSLDIELPANLRAGRCFADFVLRDSNGASVAWASLGFDGATAPALKKVSVKQKTVTDTEALWTDDQPWKQVFRSRVPLEVSCNVTTVLPQKDPVTLTASLSDCHGRMVFTETKTVPAEGGDLAFACTPDVLYNIGHRWDLELRSGDVILDTDHAELIVLPPREWDRFTLTSWGGQHLWRCQYLFDSMRTRVEDLGLDIAMNGENEINTGKVWWDYWQNIGHSYLGLLGYMGQGVPDFMDHEFSTKAAEYAKTRDKKWLVREPSLKDAQYLAGVRESITTRKMPLVSEFGGAYDYCMGDEMSLTYYTRYFDFDFGEHSLTAFREWLQERYASLDDLNQAWDTSFATWDAVMPMTLDEVKGRDNAAPWAEFRDFMNDCLADYYAMVQDAIRSVDPDAKCGLSGTQEPKPGNGMDWWQNSQAFSYYHSYNTGWSDEMRRSFQPYTGVMCTPYRCGYWQEGQGLEYQNFWCLLHDTKGISAWTTPLFFYGDFTFSEAGRDTRANTHELKSGIWDLIRAANRQHDGIAIHYSHPSINGALLMDRDTHIVGVRDAWVKLIEDLGLQYNFVSYAQIEDGLLNNPKNDGERYKVLVLPESIALSAREVAEIKQFVAGGGSVIGDMMIGLMDDKCRKQPRGLLDDVFGIERSGEDAPPPVGINVQGVPDPITLPVGETKLRAGDAELTLGSVPDTECKAVFGNGFGKGRAWYLNIDLAQFENERRFGTVTEKSVRQMMARVFEDCGVKARYPLAYDSGSAPHVEVITYAAGPVEYVSLLRDRSGEEGEVAKVALGRSAHVYDVRAGKYLGELTAITAPLLSGDCRVYCLAPAKLGGVTVSASAPDADRKVSYSVTCSPATRGETQAVRVTLLKPDGTVAADYSRNLIVGDQPVPGNVQLALNDPAGQWTVVARPLCGGDDEAARASFSAP